MRNTFKALAASFCFAVAALVAIPSFATDRQVTYTRQVQGTNQLNQQARNERFALGVMLQSLFNVYSVGAGTYANIALAPGTGLYVTAGPSASTTCGVLVQVVPADPSPLPAATPFNVTVTTPPSPLPSDPTLIAPPALQCSASSQIGPLTAPGSNSVIWLIEAQVQTVDIKPTPLQFLNNNGQPVSITLNSVRRDQPAYQAKSGTAAASPTPPPADSGYIAIGYVKVPTGTTQVTSLMISAAPSFGGIPSGSATPTPNPYKAAVLANTHLTHLWPFADAGGCTTIADAVSGGATAAPSPVPLTIVYPTTSPSPSVGCGAPPIVKDGTTSGWFPGPWACIVSVTCGGQYLTSYWDWPLSTEPTSGSYTIEAIVESNGNVDPQGGFIWNWGGCGGSICNALSIAYSGGPVGLVGNVNNASAWIATIGAEPLMVDDSWDGTSNRWYVNGVEVNQTTTAQAYASADGYIGSDVNGDYPFAGRIQYFAVYNDAESLAQIRARFVASGL